jgi:alanine-alpha-ketoisovalerate/valine-pyruvate aminotransferase
MSKTKKELVAVIEKYIDKDGNEKNVYRTVGRLIETKYGDMIKIDNIPVTKGGWDGWCYLNEPHQKDKPKEEKKPVVDRSGFGDMENDAPF